VNGLGSRLERIAVALERPPAALGPVLEARGEVPVWITLTKLDGNGVAGGLRIVTTAIQALVIENSGITLVHTGNGFAWRVRETRAQIERLIVAAMAGEAVGE
jgi:hypothetical protein